MTNGVDLTEIDYAPKTYPIAIPDHFPTFTIPDDNPITEDGVRLGQHLFYDPILSLDSTVSCSSCHLPEKAFTDGVAVSTGVNGNVGRRSSMSLINIAYAFNGLFWDGRSNTLEAQAIEPVQDPLELIEDWDNVEEKLRRNERYQTLYRKAFGISNSDEITRDLTVKAISQFERILISGDSKYDRVEYGTNAAYTNEELNGRDMFFDADPLTPDAECGHCHNGPLLTTQQYINNGIQQVEDLASFPDKGRGEVTGIIFDNGKFRAPTLRNIALTAPYMHDGRFETLEEVIEHYNSGGHFAENLDALIQPLGLTEEQKSDLLAFLHTMTDTSYLTNPFIVNPFD
ncbi:cytochrome-c peroxidase [Portibacter lacus]|uniref:Methylamine utilization protein n=1 Tax=Portibacter lacus TaxID=1099794 RepID=A0AA37SU35_9BACT|nr:cytochrome c peroxidase [Portibacter lacus]GLR19629.1 methylamine utilization protein [Portibacter lacus]